MTHADIVLPNLGFGMEEGRVLAWLKSPGDAVRKGEPVAEIESDKATVELEAVVDGVLEAILVPADQAVAVGSVLARIRTGAAPAEIVSTAPAPIAASETPGRASPVAQRLAQEHQIDLNRVQGTGPNGRILREDVEALIQAGAPLTAFAAPARPLTAPAVRKLARDHGIDLSQVRGTGSEGRIRREDVESLLSVGTPLTASVAPSPSAAIPLPATEGRREIKLSTMRQAIARRLSQSMQESPHFYTVAELDLTDAIPALPAGIGLNAFLLYCCVAALKAQPELNATYEDGRLYHYDHVHLAMAVALPEGLLTPVLHRADDYSLSGLAERSRDLTARARAGKLKPDELAGGTFTVSNLGVVKQVERFTAILNPPQVGILAVGAAKPRPVVIDGGLHIRTTAFVTLSADHRIVDGMGAARFLEALDGQVRGFE
ncbi:MAG TPA: dihydrolipoamide acetyltransferase family protein [Aggregatilineales bacterium]|nr:dihydrolipoamide acetyltransferase family protein [Aggregatilineales bacterium]